MILFIFTASAHHDAAVQQNIHNQGGEAGPSARSTETQEPHSRRADDSAV